MNRLRSAVAAAVALVVLGLQACGDDPVTPGLPEVEMIVAGGDGQYGTAGQRLGMPLRVLIRRVDTGAHQAGLAVEWAVESGDASLATSAVDTTDSGGYAEAVLRLGTVAGPVQVRATLRERSAVSVVLEAHVVEHPELLGFSSQSVRGGDTLTVEGRGFSSTPDENVVLFSGIRGRVTAATPTSLRVEVPSCLPVRDVSVTAQLGALVSHALPLAVVEDVGGVLKLDPGVPLDLADAGGFPCVRLPGGGAPYLVVIESTGTVGGARYGYALTGLSDAGAGAPTGARGASVSTNATKVPTFGVQEAFEARLRRRESELVRQGTGTPARPPAVAAAPPPVPAVGDTRSFRVLNAQGAFDEVTAVARLVSEQAVLYVDQRAPSSGYTDQDLAGFAADFDDVIFPADTAAFGVPSDLDGNQRVVILFTPTVNSLTPRGAQGFIGGFFYGLDLQVDREGSNRGEIFYGVVPDVTGQFSDPLPRSRVLEAMPAILAHEFQHMIHFNERVLKLGAGGTEALWLSEGLAQMAEELVARAFLKLGNEAAAELYRKGNRGRARSYLSNPAAVSLIISTGQASLEERGAGWLHTLYLWDRGGGNAVLRRLTASTRTGTENVAAALGASWPDVFSDWAAALYLDGTGPTPYTFEYPSVQLRELVPTATGYSLSPEVVGSVDFSRTGLLWSSSAQHYIVVPPASGSVALRLGGEAGGNMPGDAELRLRIVRFY